MTDRYVEVYFTPCAQVSAEDRSKLAALSILPPFEGQEGNVTIFLPPGSEVQHSGTEASISIPNCQ